MPDNVFDWDAICATLMKERGPDKMPLQATFISTAEGVFKRLHEQNVSLHVMLRDCREMIDKSEYAWLDVPSDEVHTTEDKKALEIMPVTVATRRLFFRLTQSWIKAMMEKACVLEGTEDYGTLLLLKCLWA
ncbi:hypothetical protein B0T21DRAFT_294810 [Apiosordaria backusii]|uniref:Uncharacterized protein n=1 Tax=Apiosordaria backusii TaxID=314023 RepID=A0AA40E3M6_9PEZI|nr:hypothetical protein B0T21DRAFT_294810 [Apiosordaria backusii]